MDYHVYHHALNYGFSEREATKMGEDAWENNQIQEAKMLRAYQNEYDAMCSKMAQEYFEAQYLEHKIEVCNWLLNKAKILDDGSSEFSDLTSNVGKLCDLYRSKESFDKGSLESEIDVLTSFFLKVNPLSDSEEFSYMLNCLGKIIEDSKRDLKKTIEELDYQRLKNNN